MKKRIMIVLSVLLMTSLVFAACSKPSSNQPGNNNNKGITTEGESSTPGDTGGNATQELRYNLHSEPPTLHPGLANDNVSGGVLNQIFEGLTTIGKSGKPEKAIAEQIDISDDQKLYTFKLRDAVWSNGDPVTAHDFEYAWKWVLDPANEAKYAYQLYYIDGAEQANTGKGSADSVGVKALDEKTLEVKLVNPTPFFLELTSFYTYLPINSKIAEANKTWADNAGDLYTSNGPFKLAEWAHNDKVILLKNDSYWDKGTVKLDKITMTIVNDENTVLGMFEKNELDWAGSPIGALPTDAIPSLRDSGKLHSQAAASTYFYKFNTTEKPFNNANIRKAFTYAIDRQSIIDNVTQGGQFPATAFVPPSIFTENSKGYFGDNAIDQAKEFLQKGLEELGYKDVSELPAITLSYNTSEGHQKIAQAIQDMWTKNLGVEVTLENSEWAVYIEKLHSLDYQVGRMGWIADFNDAINFLEMFRDKDGGNNDTGWENAQFKDLLAKSSTEKDAAKRAQLLQQAEAIFMDEMPVLPIYFYTNNWVVNDKLKDVFIDGLSNIYFKWAHFES
ncbi:peptide ABC transporter substrate-binding protein [Paenibacillus pinihumi]|uniref:peptide ABC transporter substrate-binding protein n=1 Tax=Paenibacillus pinihumi TaxID=669462 RepID=UPI0003F77C44|nr:peptide ABC transporter substrate-binding protein [Paenibacillus pinihumi]